MQSIRPSVQSSSTLLNFLRLISGEILGELTTMLTLLESMALLFFSLHCGQTDSWASWVTCLFSTSPVIFISINMTKRAGTRAFPSQKTQKQSMAQSIQAKLPQLSSSVKISKVPTWKSWQTQLKKPLRYSSKQSPGYMSMEQRMNPLRKMNICRKMDMMSGKEKRRFLLKLYISLSFSRSGNSKTGRICRKAQIGAYLGLKRMIIHINYRKRYQFRYLVWMAKLYWISLLKRRWLLLWCFSRMVWQRQMTNRREAITCQVSLRPFSFLDFDSLSSQSVSNFALTMSRLYSLYSPVSVQFLTNLLSPKLTVSLNTQLSSSQSLRALVQKSLKQVKASQTV